VSAALPDALPSKGAAVGDSHLLAPSLIAHSNLVRDLAVLNGLSATRIKGMDPMQTAVAAALREAGFLGEDSHRDQIWAKLGWAVPEPPLSVQEFLLPTACLPV